MDLFQPVLHAGCCAPLEALFISVLLVLSSIRCVMFFLCLSCISFPICFASDFVNLFPIISPAPNVLIMMSVPQRLVSSSKDEIFEIGTVIESTLIKYFSFLL